MKQTIGILNYNCGNINSVYKSIKDKTAEIKIIELPEDFKNCDKIIMPGVGHFSRAMEHLSALGFRDTLNEFALVSKKPILGICLGMQIMTKQSEEGNTVGLAWIDGEMKKFEMNDTLNFKVPHSGWNTNQILKESILTKGLEQNPEFYFVHSYYCKLNNQKNALMSCEYQDEFISAFEKDNLFGVQFHPEKSHETGLKLMDNFIKL